MYESGDKKATDLDPPPKEPAPGVKTNINKKKICKHDECDRYIIALGYCSGHYQQFKKHGTTKNLKVPTKEVNCKYKDCKRPIRSLGYCDAHYQQFKRYGKTWNISPVKGYHRRCKYLDCNALLKSSIGYCIEHQKIGYGICKFPDCNEISRSERKIYCIFHDDKNRKFVRDYGITLIQYDTLAISQNNKCAICGELKDQNYSKLVVDHCHETGRIRGLLCFSCNSGLGFFRDNLTLFNNAIQYLTKF